MNNCQYKNCPKKCNARFCNEHDFAKKFRKEKIEQKKKTSWKKARKKFSAFFEKEDEKEEKKENNHLFIYFGLNKNSSEAEFKVIYKKLVLKFHPDKGGTDEQFRELYEYTKKMKQYFSLGS